MGYSKNRPFVKVDVTGEVDKRFDELSSRVADKAEQTDLTATNNAVDLKADKTYVDTQLQSVASGSPKGTYATVTDLQNAYPTGTDGIYVVIDNGNWYYWDGAAWVSGGVYQSTGLPKTITESIDKLEYAFNNEINLGMTENYFVASDGNAAGITPGAITFDGRYSYSAIFQLNKGDIIELKSQSSPNVAILSKWDSVGNYIETLIAGNDATNIYYYTVEDTTEYLRFCNIDSLNPDFHVKKGTSVVLVEKVETLEKDLNNSVYDYNYSKYTPTVVTGYFIASSNHGTGGSEGDILSDSRYVYTDNIEVYKGEKVKVFAIGSRNVIALSKWTQSGSFLSAIFVGDETYREYEYTVTEETEYLRVSNNTDKISELSVEIGSKGDLVSVAEEIAEINKKTSSIQNKTEFVNPQSIKKPVINFQIDDGYASDVDIYNIFKSYSLVCGFALMSNVDRVSEYLNYQNEGFEIISHSTDSSAMSDGTTAVSVIEDKMKNSKETLVSKGFNITGWVTPSSELHEKYLPILKKYYEYGFTDYLGAWDSTMAEIPYNSFNEDTRKMKRVSMESSTAADCKTAIDKVVIDGGMLTFYAHNLTNGMSSTKLNDILTYTKQKTDAGECVALKPTDAYRHFFTLRHSDYLALLP